MPSPPLSEVEERHMVMMMGMVVGVMIVVAALALARVNASVVLISPSNESFSFAEAQAGFAPRVPSLGVIGTLSVANPLDACEPLQTQYIDGSGVLAFLLIERGHCSFVTKVQNAQDAGYAAAIVYDNEDDDELVTMSGNGGDIHILAVFVSKRSGQLLLGYAEDIRSRCFILPALENSPWSVMAVSFISLFAVSVVLSTFYLVRRNRFRQIGFRFLLREPTGMHVKEVKALPIVIFNSMGGSAADTCAICLEDYLDMDELRVLPCHHEFHVVCIDQWLTTQRPFCPICKQNAHCNNNKVVATESTPLLGSLTHFWHSSTPSPSQSTPVRSRHQS